MVDCYCKYVGHHRYQRLIIICCVTLILNWLYTVYCPTPDCTLKNYLTPSKSNFFFTFIVNMPIRCFYVHTLFLKLAANFTAKDFWPSYCTVKHDMTTNMTVPTKRNSDSLGLLRGKPKELVLMICGGGAYGCRGSDQFILIKRFSLVP